MAFPLLLPISTNRGSCVPICPHCGKPLWGWQEPRDHWYDRIALILLLVFTLFAVLMCLALVMLGWLMPFQGNPTLVQVVVSDFNWLLSHRLW